MKYLIPIFIISLFVVPLIAEAQCEQLGVGSAMYRLCTLIADIGYILRVFGLALAVVVIVVSGIQYMTSGGDQTKVDNAKKTLTYGIVGVAIVLAAYWIATLIEDFLVSRGIG